MTNRDPACITRTMCEALYRCHPRGKADQQISAVAERGGVMRVAVPGYFVGPEPGPGMGRGLDNYIAHVDQTVDAAGIHHVGLRTDFQIRRIEPWVARENWYEPRLKRFKPSYTVR